VFSLLDEDGNGEISKKEIKEILMYERGTQSQEFD
jgi:Ca2+-binding EF-hand superfamily protein